MSNVKKAHLWKMGTDSYIPISDMDDDHIQKAVYFAENKLRRILQSIESLDVEFGDFSLKRDNLFKEAEKRGLKLESLILPDTEKFQTLKDKINDIRINKGEAS